MIPKYVQKYFWGDDLSDLNWETHKDYIAKTLLERGDRESLRWLFEKTDDDYLLSVAKHNKIDPKSKNFWNIYLS